jgi:hypothetical protein
VTERTEREPRTQHKEWHESHECMTKAAQS